MLTDSYSADSHSIFSFRLLSAGEVVPEEMLNPQELQLWRFFREETINEKQTGHAATQKGTPMDRGVREKCTMNF